jgi:hypothetical protein
MVSGLRERFGDTSSHDLGDHSFVTVMTALMPVHYDNLENDYFAHAKLPSGSVLIAFNHLLHDAASVGAILSGSSPQGHVPTGVIKLAAPPTPQAGEMPLPVRVSKLTITGEQFDFAKSNLKLSSRNEVAFFAVARSLSKRGAENHSLMCLHSARRARGVAVGTWFG